MAAVKMTKRDAYRAMFKEYPDVVNVDQMCAMLGGISRKLCYRILRENDVEHFKIGRTYKITKLSVISYLRVTEESAAVKRQ